MTQDPNKRYVAEVVFRDDRGIYGVKPMPDLLEWEVRDLVERQYGIRKEWIVEIRFVEKPQMVLPEGDFWEPYYVDGYSRRFLPETGEMRSDYHLVRHTEETQLL